MIKYDDDCPVMELVKSDEFIKKIPFRVKKYLLRRKKTPIFCLKWNNFLRRKKGWALFLFQKIVYYIRTCECKWWITTEAKNGHEGEGRSGGTKRFIIRYLICRIFVIFFIHAKTLVLLFQSLIVKHWFRDKMQSYISKRVGLSNHSCV